MTNKIYLNFGAGNPIKKWNNLDTSPFFQLPKWLHFILYKMNLSKRSGKFIGNINYKYFKYKKGKKLPYLNNSVDVIYCSHVLEHLHVESIESLLEEFDRILKNNGVLRILVPDLKNTLNKLFKNKQVFIDICDNIGSLPENVRKSGLLSSLEGLYNFPSFHKTIINDENLNEYFKNKGEVKSDLSYLESRIPLDFLKKIELKERCDNALVFEVIKI